MDYVQDYLTNVGERKCEANAIVVLPKIAKELVTNAITNYIGDDAKSRFKNKRNLVRSELNKFLEDSGSQVLLDKLLDNINNY